MIQNLFILKKTHKKKLFSNLLYSLQGKNNNINNNNENKNKIDIKTIKYNFNIKWKFKNVSTSDYLMFVGEYCIFRICYNLHFACFSNKEFSCFSKYYKNTTKMVFIYLFCIWNDYMFSFFHHFHSIIGCSQINA